MICDRRRSARRELQQAFDRNKRPTGDERRRCGHAAVSGRVEPASGIGVATGRCSRTARIGVLAPQANTRRRQPKSSPNRRSQSTILCILRCEKCGCLIDWRASPYKGEILWQSGRRTLDSSKAVARQVCRKRRLAEPLDRNDVEVGTVGGSGSVSRRFKALSRE